MQHLLIKGGRLPDEYYSKPEGVKAVTRALYEDYCESALRR